MAERQALWAPWDEPGLEHLRLRWGEEGVVADGTFVGLRDGVPFRARYTLRCDGGWRVREVRVDPLADDGPELALLADGAGRWRTAGGAALPALDGCVDVDFAFSPFTNTLPIRRLSLAPGESRDLTVVYVTGPELRPEPDRQRYGCLGVDVGGGLYRYESDGFAADLPVDADGLVLDYPGLFRRVWSR